MLHEWPTGRANDARISAIAAPSKTWNPYAVADYTITFDFNALHLGFSARIARIIERATFALNAVDTATAHEGLVPDVPGPDARG